MKNYRFNNIQEVYHLTATVTSDVFNLSNYEIALSFLRFFKSEETKEFLNNNSVIIITTSVRVHIIIIKFFDFKIENQENFIEAVDYFLQIFNHSNKDNVCFLELKAEEEYYKGGNAKRKKRALSTPLKKIFPSKDSLKNYNYKILSINCDVPTIFSYAELLIASKETKTFKVENPIFEGENNNPKKEVKKDSSEISFGSSQNIKTLLLNIFDQVPLDVEKTFKGVNLEEDEDLKSAYEMLKVKELKNKAQESDTKPLSTDAANALSTSSATNNQTSLLEFTPEIEEFLAQNLDLGDSVRIIHKKLKESNLLFKDGTHSSLIPDYNKFRKRKSYLDFKKKYDKTKQSNS